MVAPNTPNGPGSPDDDLIRAAQRLAAGLGTGPDAPAPSEAGGVSALSPDSVPGYRIVREIHRGGQGVVYQAVQESTRRRVAIKVLREGPLATEEERARFEREVRVLGALNHPGIVTIHDSGSAGGLLFFVMDYIPGQPLDVWMASSERSVRETLRLFARICDAVQAAHVRGILHRDIKPGNIRIDEDGSPHVLDFGLAKTPVEDALGAGSSVMTLTGQFVGSLPWASPEQTDGARDGLDLRSDVYSLGVVLFQVLTGRFPYEVVGNVVDVIANVRAAEPVRPSTLRADVDDEVETIVLQCLQKERDRRYQTAGELSEDIGNYLAGRPIRAKRDSTLYVLRKTLAKHRGAVAAVVVGLVVLAVAYADSMYLLKIASDERDRAEEAVRTADEARAEAEADRARLARALYVNRVHLAGYALEEGNTARAKELLAESPADLRGWEWAHLAGRCDRSDRALAGHDGTVLAVATSPDGLRAATGGSDGTVRLWDVPSGLHRRTAELHAGAVRAVAFSLDGARVWSASDDGTLRALDALTGDVAGAPIAPGPAIRALALHPDGRRLALGLEDGSIAFGAPGALERIPVGEHPIAALAVTPDGATLVAGDGGGAITLVSAATGAVARTLAGHAGGVFSLAVAPDGARLFSGGADDAARWWDLDTGVELARFAGHGSWVFAVDVDPYGELLLTAGADHAVRLWRTDGALVTTMRGHEDRVYAAAFGPEGRRVLSGSRDGTARTWRVDAVDDALRLPEVADHARACAVSPDGARVAVAYGDGVVRLWDARDAEVAPRVLRGHTGSVQGVLFAGERFVVTCSGEDGTVRAWEPSTGVELRRFDEPGARTIAASPDGARVACGTRGGELVVRDLVTGEELARAQVGESAIGCLAWSPSAERIVTGGSDRALRLWSADDLAPIAEAPVDRWFLWSAAWSPDGERIAAASMNGTTRVWRAADLAELAVLRGHRDGVRCVAWHPDGARLATGGWDATVRIWDPASGEETLTLRGHSGRVDGLCFSPDGRRLVSTGLGGEALIWEADARR